MDWGIPPTEYVSALTAVTSTLARFAFANGVKITWWRTAIALSCIAVTMIVVDRPLIQRAVGFVSVQLTSPVEISVAIAPEIPLGYTGYQNGRGFWQQVMSQPMFSVFKDYNSKSPIKPWLSGCRGSCTGFIEEGGLAAQCNSTTAPISYLANKSSERTGKPESPFSVSFDVDYYEALDRPPPIVAKFAYSEYSSEQAVL